MAKDPVCHMDVDPKKAAAQSSYKGEVIYFCAVGCKTKFDADPGKYLPAPSDRLAVSRGPRPLRARDGGVGGQHPRGRLHPHRAADRPGPRRRGERGVHAVAGLRGAAGARARSSGATPIPRSPRTSPAERRADGGGLHAAAGRAVRAARRAPGSSSMPASRSPGWPARSPSCPRPPPRGSLPATRARCWELDTAGWEDLPDSCFTYSAAGRALLGSRAGDHPGDARALQPAARRPEVFVRRKVSRLVPDGPAPSPVSLDARQRSRLRPPLRDRPRLGHASWPPTRSRRGCPISASAASPRPRSPRLIGQPADRALRRAHPGLARGRTRAAPSSTT